MALTFEIGDVERPRGHAMLYFGSPETELLATYIILLPVKMDVSKYLPPMLAAQLGSMGGSLLGGAADSFAAPPIPEAVESIELIRHLAEIRGDDLVWGGNMVLGDIQASMVQTAEAVQEYATLYHSYIQASPEPLPPAVQELGEAGGNVLDVMYELLGDRGRLGEMSKLVGTMRFAVESNDASLIKETDASLAALSGMLPERFWADRVRSMAKDPSEAASKLAQLYVERCYKLMDEDFASVDALESEIAKLAEERPPREDLRS